MAALGSNPVFMALDLCLIELHRKLQGLMQLIDYDTDKVWSAKTKTKEIWKKLPLASTRRRRRKLITNFAWHLINLGGVLREMWNLYFLPHSCWEHFVKTSFHWPEASCTVDSDLYDLHSIDALWDLLFWSHWKVSAVQKAWQSLFTYAVQSLLLLLNYWQMLGFSLSCSSSCFWIVLNPVQMNSFAKCFKV